MPMLCGNLSPDKEKNPAFGGVTANTRAYMYIYWPILGDLFIFVGFAKDIVANAILSADLNECMLSRIKKNV